MPLRLAPGSRLAGRDDKGGGSGPFSKYHYMETLITILIIVAVLVVIAVVLRKKAEQPAPESAPEKPSGFLLKNYVMNKSESTLYGMLMRALSDNYVVLSKIRIEDFVDVNKNELSREEAFGLRNRIKSRHVDFLICDRNSKPLMAVELDGGSHNNYHRAQRDEFVDGVYREAGLPVRHIRSGSDFAAGINGIRRDLKEANEQEEKI